MRRRPTTPPHPKPATADFQLVPRAQAIETVFHIGGYALCATVVLCCLSCSQDSGQTPGEQTQLVTTDRVAAASPEEQASAQLSPQQSAVSDVTPHPEAKDGLSTRGSGTKEPVPEGPTKDGAQSAARITTSTDKEWIETMHRVMNPANDGWDTELFAEHAGKQLKHLGAFLMRDDPPSQDGLSGLLTTGFSCTPLRPAEREEVFADRSVTVERAQHLAQARVHVGVEGLASALEELTADLYGASDRRFKFKVIRVKPADQHVDTVVLFELSGRIASGAIQRSATWKCRWEPPAPDGEPRLLSIILDDYEEVVVRSTSQALFSDCTESIFRDIPAYDEQFRRGIDFWRARLENYLGIYYDGLRGMAICDVNGDGLEDVYLCEPGGLPNRLFVQLPDGLLRDVSAESGIDLFESTRTALFVDLDNDGDQDMVTPIEKQVQFFSNDGTGHFTREAKLPFEGQTALSLAAADYDQDGNIDVYACFYHGQDEEESNRTPAPLPYHDARSGGYNHLLRNEGNWSFRDVTDDVGLDDNNDRWSFASVWDDYDNDGDLDLYVANDFGRNNLYRYDGGTFTDVAGPAGAEDMNFGMSAAFGDYNRDGWMDIYVSNMFSSAGGRISFQPGFQTDGTDEAIAAFQRMSAGNTLLRNAGDGTFRNVSSKARVGVGRWAWGSIFADVNNDGWEDIVVANGLATGDLPGDL